MFGLFYRFLPMPVRIGIFIVLTLVFTANWLLVGDYRSTTSEYGEGGDEAGKRASIPPMFLPIEPTSKIIAIKEEHRKRPFVVGTETTTAYFGLPVVESTVRDFYHEALKKEGWKIDSEKSTSDETVIETSKDKMRGHIRIIHETAGSDLELAVTKDSKED